MKGFLDRLIQVHQAHWRFDPWYRRAWYIWPQAGALLAAVLIFEPARGASAPDAPWAKPAPTVPAPAPAPAPVPPAPAPAPAVSAATEADKNVCRGNNFDAAVVACNRIIETVPKNDPFLADAYTLMGRARFNKKQYDLALDALNKSLVILPTGDGTLNYRGLVYREQNKFDLAIADFQAAIRHNPSWSYPHANLAEIYRRKKDLDLAAAKVADAMKIDPKDPWTLNVKTRLHEDRREFQDAIASATQWIAVAPTEAEAYYRRGVVESQAKDFRAAIADLDEATRLGWSNSVLFANRGHAHEQSGNIDKALLDYTAALKIDPKERFAMYRRAHIYLSRNLRNDALASADELVTLDPNDFDYRLLRARVWLARQAYAGAVLDLDVATRLMPNHAYARYLRGEAYLFQEVATIEPCKKYGHPTSNPDTWSTGGAKDFKCTQGPDFEGAIKDFDEALRLKPDMTGAYVNRGSAYLWLGKRQLAEKDLRKAYSLDPKNPDLINMMQKAGIKP